MELVRGVEQKALALRGQVPDRAFADIDEPAPELGLPMERLLYAPAFKADIRNLTMEDAELDIVTDALYEQVHVDPARLLTNVRRALQTRAQVSLATLVEACPIEQGLAELATYLKLATQEVAAVIDDERTEHIDWTDSGGRRRRASLPLVIFTLREHTTNE